MEFEQTTSLAGLWARRKSAPNRGSSTRQSMPLRKPLVRVILVFSAIFLLYLGCFLPTNPWDRETLLINSLESEQAHQSSQQSVFPPAKIIRHLNCNVEREHLAAIQHRFGLEHRLRYLKRYVRFHRHADIHRESITYLSQTFLSSKFRTLDVRKKHAEVQCDPPLEVDVTASAFPHAVDASIFMFGISTTYARLVNAETSPIDEWKFWLTNGQDAPNGAKLLLMLLDASDAQLQEIANTLGDAGIDAEVYHSQSSVAMAVRYFDLIPLLHNHPEARSKTWLVLCDDDTFFPFMQALVERFKVLDASVPIYAGTLSEDVFSVERHGSQAFGGGGVFLSLPMAETLSQLYDNCTTREKGPQGDVLLRKCIYENTDVRLKTIWDLWQLDIMGDGAGFYEWGKQPLSIHHYRGGDWTLAKPVQFTKIAHICGEDCILQRFKTQDGFVMSGHSVAYYPEGIDFDWEMVEKTMDVMPPDKGWNLDFMFGPQRPSLSRTGRKIAWDLQESQVQPDGSVLQTYTRRWDDWRWMYPDDSPISSLDSILELVWIPA